MYFDSNFTEVGSLESNWQYVSIGSGNGWEPNRQYWPSFTNTHMRGGGGGGGGGELMYNVH